MSAQSVSEEDMGQISQEEMHSALFAHLVTQQSNMAMMLMGKLAHPETGQVTQNIDAAKLFIDQLEMLEAKTKGNLSKEESSLLKQTLMSLRLTFVEAIESSPAQPAAAPKQAAAQPQAARPAEADKVTPSSEAAAGAEEDHRKKFSKKY